MDIQTRILQQITQTLTANKLTLHNTTLKQKEKDKKEQQKRIYHFHLICTILMLTDLPPFLMCQPTDIQNYLSTNLLHQLYSSLILTLFILNQEVKEMSGLRGIETLDEINFHLTNNL
uniref:Uncharacterized protein n=1 Tax=Octopus bimaculoides TaxID=37653 RepID=A0A0L8G033_OCTBM